MRIRRRPCWLLTALCVAVCGLWGQAVSAQDSISQTILQAQAELSPQEQANVNAFLDAQLARMQSNGPSEVAQGRARIAEQFTISLSENFLNYYRQELGRRAATLIKPDLPLMTRLNVAVLSAKLTGDGLLSVLQTGASDQSPAVRYWIAKAVGAAAKDGAFDSQQQQIVLNVLAQRLKDEDSSLVLEQIMVAIAEINLPQAIQTVLEGLDSRVALHVNNPDLRYKPVLNGMQQLWSKLIALRTNNQNVNKEQHELARIAFRYYALIADQLAAMQNDGENDETLTQDKAQMALICSRVMDDVVKEMAPNVARPLPVDTSNAAELKVSRDRWRDILKAPPFNFTDDQLKVGE